MRFAFVLAGAGLLLLTACSTGRPLLERQPAPKPTSIRSDRLAFRYGRAAGGDASNARRHASAHLDGGAHARGDAAGDSDPDPTRAPEPATPEPTPAATPTPAPTPAEVAPPPACHACDRFVHQCASRTAGRRAARPDACPCRRAPTSTTR